MYYNYRYPTIPLGTITIQFNKNPNDDIKCVCTRVVTGRNKTVPIPSRENKHLNFNSYQEESDSNIIERHLTHKDLSNEINAVSNINTSLDRLNSECTDEPDQTQREDCNRNEATENLSSGFCGLFCCCGSMLQFLRKKLSKRRNYKGLEKQKTDDCITESTNFVSPDGFSESTDQQVCSTSPVPDTRNTSSAVVDVVAAEENCSPTISICADPVKSGLQSMGFTFEASRSDIKTLYQRVSLDYDEDKLNRLNKNLILQCNPQNISVPVPSTHSTIASDTTMQPSCFSNLESTNGTDQVGHVQQKANKRSGSDQNGNTKKKAKRKKSRNTDELDVLKGIALPPEILADRTLKKYWLNRYRLFSKFDLGIKLDAESWYSVTPEKISKHLADRCCSDVIVDGFCGAGGNAIQFAFTCERVIAIDIDLQKIELAKHNAAIYGVADRIEFIVGDFFHVAPCLKADVVFLSPPWGGPNYNRSETFPLSKILEPYGGVHLFQVARKISEHIAYYLPRNVNVDEVIKLGGPGSKAEIEQNVIDGGLKAVTAYFGELVYEEEDD